ncbi:MAG: tRNA (adenosine(37)-N6)-threonylcarbamoyltransferase complex dimerization subunit type 1 TsaB [Rhodobacterales bacterium]|nr:tRNA (adenosine(37)-N6)-threonylcarbamoyltransferase complex dimerization subunit type 1 TsaB [Rhodobacterales bacterium]
MRVISVDTAGPIVGVGLWCNETATVRYERIKRGAEARLVPWALELCADAGIAMSDLNGVAVARGPGAFTGIRVGMATALGLAAGLRIEVAALSSLRSRALRLQHVLPVLSMLDARKGRVYASLFLDGVRVHDAADVDPGVALSWPEGPFVATGEGAVVYADAVVAAGGTLAEDAENPAVGVLAQLGAQAFRAGEGLSPRNVQPVYLREPDAKPPQR